MAKTLRVVTDEAGRRWVKAADVPEVAKLGLPPLRKLCPGVAHFEEDGRPVRWLPVDGMAAVLLERGMAQADAEARVSSYEAAPLSGEGRRRQGLPRLPVQPSSLMTGTELLDEVAALPGDMFARSLDHLVDAEAVEPPVVAPGAPDQAMVELVPFEVEGWPLARAEGSVVPLIRDLDLAERLGYERPRDIRKLIKRMVDDGKIAGVSMRATVARIQLRPGVERDQTVDEFWLTEAQALKVAARSETEPADALLDEMIRVFMLARRGQLPAMAQPLPAPDPRLDRILAAMEAQSQATTAMLGILGTMVQRIDRPAPAPAPAPQPAAPPQAVAAPLPPVAAPPSPPPTMLIPRDWRSSDVIAALLTERRGHRVARSKVDGAISALKLRERPGVARYGMTPRTDGGGVSYQVPFWRYAPCVVDVIERHMFVESAAQQSIPGAN